MQIKKAYTSLAADLTALASNVTGAAFTLTATSAGDGMAHKITVRNDSATDHSGKTLALVGTAYDGGTLTETLTAPGTSATVTSTNYFLTLTSITPSATIGADTFDIGIAAAAISPPVNVQSRASVPWTPIGISVDSPATSAYSLQQSYGGEWYAHASIATKTASADGSILYPVSALRLIVTAASALTLNIVMAG